MAILIVRGGDEAFRAVFALMVVTTVVDATDGWLARKVRVKEVLPGFDGRTLDDLIDFHVYTSLPLLLLWRARILPDSLQWLLLVPLLASAYGYSQTNAKTADGFFLGFPSLWNAVAFYLYFLETPVWLSAAAIVFFSTLTFVPTRYLYASRGGPFARVITVGGVVWTLLVVLVLARPASERHTLALVSMIYPVLYLALSWTIGRRFPAGVRADQSAPL